MHLAELAEYRKTTNGRSEELFYFHSASQPDDGLHSCNYAKIASELEVGSGSKIIFAGADMTGI